MFTMFTHFPKLLRNPVVFLLPILIIVILLTIDLNDAKEAKKNAIIQQETKVEDFTLTPVKSTQQSTFARLYSLLQTLQYNCLDNRPVGGVEGHEGVWQIYSFGINNDFTWDDAILDATGCTVHSFDPTMKMNETKRNAKSYFHPIGIGSRNDDNFASGDKFSMGAKGRNWTIRTLDQMKKNYQSTTIPILKIDTEYNEWEVLEQWLEAGSLVNVDQLLMEVHFWPQKEDPEMFKQPNRQIGIMNKWISILDRLHSHGFKLYNVHLNPMSSKVDLGLGL
ncbi:Methyltransferase-like protein 24 [Nowakowskiella sp. JEL0407]|nr:Methyltransferase-like protein 24 [Nowakowskiella sp. JEL0407]